MDKKEKIEKIEKIEKDMPKKSSSPIIILTVIALVIAFIMVYKHVTSIIVDTNIENMEELAEHDKQSIENTLTGQWNNVNGIAKEFRKNKYETITELLSELAIKKVFLNCQDLILVDTEGNMYHANGVIDRNNDYIELVKSSLGNFIYRYDNSSLTVEKRKELLLVGMKINTFSVEDITFCYILEELDVNTLQGQLRIEVYNGEGYSSVISGNGTYIVSASRRHSLQAKENFFRDFAAGRFDEGHTIDSIAEEIRSLNKGDTLSTTCRIADETYIMIFTPVESADWYYVMTVPRSVFEAQSARIVRIYGVLAAVIMLVIGAGVVLFSRAQRQKAKADAKHHKELAEAYQLAQQANRAKTTFLNNMSHDIRTPMNAIIGYTTLATTHIDNLDAVKDYLSKITQSSNHLLSLINDVLDMSRIESGKVTINETEENLSEILYNLKDIIQADVKAKQMNFLIDALDITNENIWCDRLRLNQVLLNILSNAVKYTAPGGTISMHAAQKQAAHTNQAVYEFRVKDNGIGMSEEFVKTVFDPFTREQTSTVSGIQGTGLGMAITKNIVELMGGTIVCSSTEHVGTEFIVTLEFRLQTEHNVQNKTEDASYEIDFAGKRILLVEDNEINQEIAVAILTEAGFVMETADNGKLACDILLEKGAGYYDLVLMDVQMPVMDGYEATRTIRKFENKPLAKIPIIAMTANAFAEDKQAAKDAGMDEHIAKPIDVPKLFEALQTVLNKK